MNSYLDVSEHLERELTPEPVMGPAVGSLALHGGLIAALVFYGLITGLFHHNFWGKEGPGGAMQVSLSDAIPLPATQPVNQNVLATETPSQAPAPPSPKETQRVDEKAIPIPGKRVRPKEKTTPKTQQHQPTPPQNRAAYGETQASSIPRAMQPQTATAGVNVSNGDFGSRFPWYVQVIKTKVDQNWLRGEVDPRTPRDATVTIYFRVNLSGAPASFKVYKSSGSPTLDRSCLEAAERVDTFGSLPQGAGVTYLDVTYDCTY